MADDRTEASLDGAPDDPAAIPTDAPLDGSTGGYRALTWRSALLDPHSFVPVLLLAVLALVAFPFADTFRGAAVIAFPFNAGLLYLALKRSRVRPGTMRFAFVVLGVVAVGTLANVVVGIFTHVDERYILVIDMALYAVLYAVAFPAVVRRAFQHRRVTLNTLAAAISAYIIIGLWFTSIYRGLDAISAMHGYEFFKGVKETRAGDFVYYSFITLTTVGYGDYVPVSDAGRAMAVLEAVGGQVFLVTAVARIVSLLGTEQRQPSSAPMHSFGDEAELD